MTVQVTLITPVFNGEGVLRRCVESIATAAEGYSVELIIVDDGSTDGTPEVARELAANWPWIRYLRQDNSGPSAARNAGLEHAHGDYVGFVDADDTISESYFDYVVDKIKSTGADVVIFGANRMALNGECIERPNILADLSSSDVAQIQLQVTRFRSIYWYTCSRVISKDVIRGLSFAKDVKLGEDVIFNVACLNKARRVLVVPDCLYNYYETPGSLTSARFKPALLESTEAHYGARIEAHVWPEDEADRQLLLCDFARSYLEHMLPYLLNNLQYLPVRDQKVQLKRIRESIVYQECIPNYAGRHPSTTMRLVIRTFMDRKLSLTLLILRASRGVGAARRVGRNAFGPRKAARGAAS